MALSQHIGLSLLDTERDKLLSQFDDAVKATADDPVKTEHGNVGESLFREFLANFLPKKYGVTKGYILTPNLDYESDNLEEWDVIIFDALQSPILSIRRNVDEHNSAGKRAIPLEYVRAVIEVKSTFNKAAANKVAEKLNKLNAFGTYKSQHPDDPPTLPYGFFSTAVFFENKSARRDEYRMALTALAPLFPSVGRVHCIGALILRALRYPEKSGSLGFYMETTMSTTGPMMTDASEFSDMFYPYPGDSSKKGYVVSHGFSENVFWNFMLLLMYYLNDHGNEQGWNGRPISRQYGFSLDRPDRIPLFCASDAHTGDPPTIS